MSKHFSHLVWLGAGTATEPAGLLDCAEQIILVEARESACLSLQQKYPQEQFRIQQRLLTVDGSSVEFTQYNLVEYSAIQPATGLKALFPGLKAANSERLNSTRITDLITELALHSHNNLLVIEIGDSNLALIAAMQQHGQLNQFSEIRIQTSIESLYASAATASEISTFLQEHGYLLQYTSEQDPDLPWLSFSLNPLWQTLQHTLQAKDSLNKEKDTLSKERDLLLSEKETLGKELENAKQNLAAAQQRSEEAKVAAAKELDTVKQQFSAEKQQMTLNTEQYQQELTEQKYQLEQQLAGARQELEKKVAENEALHQQLKTIQAASYNTEASLAEQIKTHEGELTTLVNQRDQVYLQLSTLQQQHTELNTNFEQLKVEVQRLQAELANSTQQLTAIKHEQGLQVNKLQSELELANKQAAVRLEKITQLEKSNQTLSNVNAQLTKQQQALKQEMLKAEAQIEIIKDLLLKQ